MDSTVQKHTLCPCQLVQMHHPVGLITRLNTVLLLQLLHISTQNQLARLGIAVALLWTAANDHDCWVVGRTLLLVLCICMFQSFIREPADKCELLFHSFNELQIRSWIIERIGKWRYTCFLNGQQYCWCLLMTFHVISFYFYWRFAMRIFSGEFWWILSNMHFINVTSCCKGELF